jgi:transcriptional regulator with XRE-family HTH domain
MDNSFGEYFRALRKKAEKTLRAFCNEVGADPVTINRIERGFLPPPSGDLANKCIEALGLKTENEKQDFRDRCQHYEVPTEEEIAKENMIPRAQAEAINAIKKTGLESGTIECPICKGELYFEVHNNGHVWGKCVSQGCLAWMQ